MLRRGRGAGGDRPSAVVSRRLAAASVLALVACLVPGTGAAAVNSHDGVPVPLCGAATGAPAGLSCDAWVQPAARAATAAASSPPNTALWPADLRRAYNLPSSGTRSQTVAIVNPYGAPTIARDLQKFSSQFGLPQCTASSGCLRVVSEGGNTTALPVANGDWPAEATLGVETVHGICTTCHIMLVETNSSSISDLTAGVDTAARLGVSEISISFLAREAFNDSYWAPHYNHPGVVIVAASGDNGYDTSPAFPASLPNVVAVGGTHLNLRADGSYGGESAWSSAGSGCSSLFPAASWQATAAGAAGCGGHRAVADVSADADPTTGTAIFTSTPVPGQGGATGWFQIGGTSLAAPLIAGVFALAGGTPPTVSPLATLYAHRSGLHDVTSGANGQCGGHSICQSGPGYDGPTGLGTPNGLAAFIAPRSSPAGLDPSHPNLSVTPTRIRVRSTTALRVSVLNRNGLTVSGSVSLASANRVHYPTSRSAARIVSFGTQGVHIGAHRSATPTFTMSRSVALLLARLRQITLIVTVRLGDTGGHRATVRQRLVLDYLPKR
jgi:hypothetical protein